MPNRNFNILLIILLILSQSFSCKCSENSNREEAVNEALYKSSRFELSPLMKLFLADYEKEQKGRISETFIEKYNLKKIEKDYYFQGSASTTDQYDDRELEKIGIKIGSQFQGVINLLVPLGKINEFLNLNSITYFEISSRANLK